MWEVEHCVHLAETTALTVCRMGAAALCPHAMLRHYQGAAPDAVWLAIGLELLRRSDAILMLPGWRTSNGASAEYNLARGLDLPIFEDLRHLASWINVQRELDAQRQYVSVNDDHARA